ncbi:Ger(x)C family spore germination C-terminal domain-containing protein [Piscibacillus halophilus]|uniref:Ger(x)C family spore germination C-terminal domain-containing protein n=1 Tax=Piscibacillus halophilus TaxID=571933 RepID=UPI001588F990|nr:Ger(x)C family spore germination C-terminal domain-containing protein [Piscibacillus halophilus]
MPAGELGVSVEDEQEESQKDSPQNQINDAKSDVLAINGTAVFKGGSLKGYLNKRETRGLLSIKGDIEDEVVVLNCNGDEDGTISLVLRETRTDFTPKISGDRIEMDVTIQAGADIRDISCPNQELNTEEIEELNKQLASHIEADSNMVLNKVKNEWEADIFGFGETIYRKHPKKWDEIAPEWRSGVLKDMKVNLQVKANVSRYGLQKEPTTVDDSR